MIRLKVYRKALWSRKIGDDLFHRGREDPKVRLHKPALGKGVKKVANTAMGL